MEARTVLQRSTAVWGGDSEKIVIGARAKFLLLAPDQQKP